MSENAGDLPADEDSDGSSSDTHGANNKRLKLEDNEDRLSALPDSIIHHILSYLPSTKEIIQTSILSKRWLHQWTRVPVFIFDVSPESPYAGSGKDFSSYIDSSLMFYDSPKIKKFQLEIECSSGDCNRAIRFASLKNVEELILSFFIRVEVYKLPKFLFSNSSLRLLETYECLFESGFRVDFKSFKVLRIHHCELGDGAIENVLCGSPELESFELTGSFGFTKLLIASNSLKSLLLGADLSASLIEIECPQLKNLVLYLDLDLLHPLSFKSKLPSLLCVILHFPCDAGDSYAEMAKQLLEQFAKARELRIQSELIKTASKAGGLCPPLNCKSLTLESYCFDTYLHEIK